MRKLDLTAEQRERIRHHFPEDLRPKRSRKMSSSPERLGGRSEVLQRPEKGLSGSTMVRAKGDGLANDRYRSSR